MKISKSMPLQDSLAMLAYDGLRTHVPDGDVRDFTAFKKWFYCYASLLR